jgi:hypothetical protein
MDPELAGDPPPEAGDDVELVVLDVKAHDPGFYMNRTRTYFVAQDGSVYLVRAPGQPVTLQREDDLPADCDLSLVDDLALLHLGEAANLAGRRLVSGGGDALALNSSSGRQPGVTATQTPFAVSALLERHGELLP